MEEKLVRMEEENRRLRLASGINVKQEEVVKQEPRDIQPVIPTSGFPGVGGPSSSLTRGDIADDQISVDGDDEDVVFVSAKWAATRAVPLALPLRTREWSIPVVFQKLILQHLFVRSPIRTSQKARPRPVLSIGKLRPPVSGRERSRVGC
jgi:hypothetical protein